MYNQRISILEPCHMKWKDLDKINKSKNRHCNECSIDIIDFSQMSNEEIIKYLSERKKERVCAKTFSVDKRSKFSKVQKKVLNWRENSKSKNNYNYLKSVVLVLSGLMLFLTGCRIAVGEPAIPCWNEIVPDTTTVEPGDSIIIEVCE